MINTYEIGQSIMLQKQYCDTEKFPLFIPADGVCYNRKCRKNIFNPGGYTVQQAAYAHITGCPFCHDTWCD